MLKSLIIFVVAIYLLFLIFAYFFADQMIFLPPLSGYIDTNDVIKLTTKDGVRISAVYLPNVHAKYTILFSHGNAEDLGYILPFLQDLNAQGFSVFSYDYRGYGTSKGRPTESRAYADANAAYDYLVNNLHVAPKHIVVFGRSLGAALAIDLAARKPVAGLIVESAFVTAFRVLTRIPVLPFDKFNNLRKIKQVRCPVLVIHAINDTVVPFWHGYKLYQVIKTPKQYLWVQNADHNDLFWVADKNYWPTIHKFAGGLD
ncbi:MAG: alpha/beta hydrolase [Gammaproteobacteria bacterium]|jgi:fermentation-respiration switch protein FrsA (DUF1100 family)